MKKLSPLFFIFVVVFLFYYQTLFVYFSQDDFFMFKASQTNGTLGGFLNLFAIHSFSERGIAFYRPIFREALHNIYFSVCGLNHLPFRILMMVVHFINISLVYFLVNKVFGNKILATFAALFFGITAANVALLYYLAGGIEAGGATMFALLTLILYRKYLANNNLAVYLATFVTFLLALFSHEIVGMTVGVMFIMLVTSNVKKIFSKIVALLPFLFATTFLFYIDLVKIGLSPGEKQYQFIFSISSILNSVFWYSVWALGIPEMLIDFIGPGIKLNPVLMRYWGNYYTVIFIAFGIALSIFLFMFLYLILKKKVVFFDRRFWFFLLWLMVGLLPVIFLPSHKSTHYLVFVLPAFWTVVAYIVLNFHRTMLKHKLIAILLATLLIASLIVLSAASINLQDTTYWAASRGRLAERLINQIKSTYPNLPKGATIYFENDPNYPILTQEWGSSSKQAAFILNNQDALRLVYNDPNLKVYYQDLNKPSEEPKEGTIYRIKAKIY